MTVTGCTFSGNTCANGFAANLGGGLYNYGQATLTGCTIVGNSGQDTVFGGGDNGDGLYNNGQATLTDCAIAGNSSSFGDGGGLDNDKAGTVTLVNCSLSSNSVQTAFATVGARPLGGGGVVNSGTATLTGCVLSANRAALRGGGLHNTGGTATLTGCTLAGNSAGYNVDPNFSGYAGGGAVFVDGGTVNLTDDILSGDTSPNGAEISGAVAASHCDIGQSGFGQLGSPATPDASGSFDADPLFVSGSDLHLQSGSPCAGTGTVSAPSNSYLPYDIDGRPRPTPPYTAPSIGAYEAAPTGAYSLVVENTGDGVPQSLRADVQCANDYPNAAITFDPQVFTTLQTIPIRGGQLTLTQPMSITGPAAGVAIDGGYDHATGSGGVRIFRVTGGTPAAPVALSGLTLQNGYAGSDPNGGGGLLNDGAAVTLTRCALTGNVAAQGGGLSDIASGAATLTDCILTGNAATQGGTGGGGVLAFGVVTLTNCVLAANSAPTGGGLLNDGGTATVTECTFTGNSAASGAGGGLANTGMARLTDDILYRDTGGEIANRLSGTTTATFCDIQGGYPGSQNFDADPQFVSPPANLRVRPGSPAVFSGTPSAPNGSYSAYDITGAMRDASHPTVGAYEGKVASTDVQLRAPGAVPYGMMTTLTATVTALAGGIAPTGSVAFSYTPAGSATPVTFDTVALTAGSGSQATASSTAFAVPGGTALPGGDYTLTATYLPDNPRFLTKTSPSQRVTVQKATTTVTVTDNGPNPSVYGQAVTVTVTVAPTGGPTGPATPTGSVTLDGFPGSMTLDSSGKATFTTSALPVGMDTLSASYNPGTDPNYRSADSLNPQVTQTVNAIASNVTGQVTVARGGYRFVRATGHYLQPVTLTNNGAALADTISLVLDSLSPGTVTLVGAAGKTQYATPAGSPYVNLPSGGLAHGASATVTLEFTALPTGYTARVLAGTGVR